MILNPCCSELVTYLGITDIEEIRLVLKNICEKFNYKVMLCVETGETEEFIKGFEIELDKLGINEEITVFTYNDCLVYNHFEWSLEDKEINKAFYDKHIDRVIRLRELLSSKIGVQVDKECYYGLYLTDGQGVFVELTYKLCAGYDETPGLSLRASQHCITEEFPILGNVYNMDPGRYEYYAFDGRSTYDFEVWLGVINPDDRHVEKSNVSNSLAGKIIDLIAKL